MPARYTDLESATRDSRDFIIRKRTPTILQLVLIFVGALLSAIGMGYTADNKMLLIGTLFCLFSALAWYVFVQIQRNRDLVMTTEFQNALFASALGAKNKFCLIIKRDGNIVYFDRAFQELFSDFMKMPRRSIDVLLDHGKVSHEDVDKIFNTIQRDVFDKAIFDIRGSDGQYYKIVMSIEPILRPKGFILLRGREFIDQRADKDAPQATLAPMLNRSTATLFSYVMDGMDMGIYMTDPAGGIMYANHLLEQWLGYDENEMVSSNLSLQNIFYHNNAHTESIIPDNYEGEVTLQQKTGGSINAFLNQKVIRDDQNKVIGCTAMVTNIEKQAADGKKKLW